LDRKKYFEMSQNCPKTEKCPLFVGNMLVSEVAHKIYMDLFCTKEDAWQNKCVRYKLSQIFKGPVSVDVMPNDKRNLEELIEKYKPKT
jgi:hypothetical protein